MRTEVHVTVRLAQGAAAALSAWASERGWHLTQILLARGVCPEQLMVTGAADGDWPEVCALTDAACEGLRALPGVTPVRRKIEIDARALAEDGAAPPPLYYEQHVKVRCGSADVAALGAIGRRHDSHLSRSPLGGDGTEARFLTRRLRLASDGGVAVAARLAADLGAAGFAVLKIEHEAVLFDDNLALDAGWMEASSP